MGHPGNSREIICIYESPLFLGLAFFARKKADFLSKFNYELSQELGIVGRK